MGTIMKQFFELSNETEDTDDQFPAEFYNQPDFEASDDEEPDEESDEESNEESDEDLGASRKSGDGKSYNRTDGICIRTVIKQERVKVSNADHTLYLTYCISIRNTPIFSRLKPRLAKKVSCR
jgi:hypothetical protein